MLANFTNLININTGYGGIPDSQVKVKTSSFLVCVSVRRYRLNSLSTTVNCTATGRQWKNNTMVNVPSVTEQQISLKHAMIINACKYISRSLKFIFKHVNDLTYSACTVKAL